MVKNRDLLGQAQGVSCPQVNGTRGVPGAGWTGGTVAEGSQMVGNAGDLSEHDF